MPNNAAIFYSLLYLKHKITKHQNGGPLYGSPKAHVPWPVSRFIDHQFEADAESNY